MKKVIVLLTLSCILAGCTSKENTETDVPKENLEATQLKETATENLKIVTDEEYVKEMKEKDYVIDAKYSIVEALNIATLSLVVKENITLEEIETLVKKEQQTFEKENPEMLPVIKVYQNGNEVYNTLELE